MNEKKELRAALKKRRAEYPEESRVKASAAIAQRLFDSPQYAQCGKLLCFVSVGSEPDTAEIIDRALDDGKLVAVPRCLSGKNEMRFYLISSRSQLEKGAFGIYEPNEDCEQITEFSDALCIVPALAFDKRGHRLGYGGGYYDRFLADFGVASCGICRISCGVCFDSLFLQEQLPAEPTDIPVDMLITQSRTLLFK